jgi:hypothetical protein
MCYICHKNVVSNVSNSIHFHYWVIPENIHTSPTQGPMGCIGGVYSYIPVLPDRFLLKVSSYGPAPTEEIVS